MQAHAQHARIHTYHGPKRQLLGHSAGAAPPAWKSNQQMIQKRALNAPDVGSKILLSRLPMDVGQEEVESLFQKTVGPVKETFIVFNNTGVSKGMAIVSFHRSGDASVARQKYNGKIIDGRRPIKLEIIKDEDDVPKAPPPKPQPSLLERIGDVAKKPASAPSLQPSANVSTGMSSIAARKQQQAAKEVQGLAAKPKAMNSRQRLRVKKGPRRLNKQHKTTEELDKDMDEYQAQGNDTAKVAVS